LQELKLEMYHKMKECQKMIGFKNYLDLLDVIAQQEKIIVKQNELIARLVNETAEKENMINELMKDVAY